MGMLQALAMLGAGAQGYMNADDLMRKRKIEDDQLARQKVMQGREDQQYMQAQTDDQAARNAMAPVTVDSAPVAVPIGSRDEPQAPEDRGIRVAGQQFPDQASAQAAADGQNTITARMQRAAGVVQNPLLAAKLGGDAQTAELAGLNLTSAKRTAGNQKFDDDAHAALFTRDPGVLKRFLNDSHADGKNGAVKFDVQTDPATGAQQAFRIADDGALVPFGPKIANDNDRIQALYQLSKSVSPADKEKHVLEQSRLTRQEKRDADLNANTIEHNKVLDRYYTGVIDARFDKNDVDANKPGKGSAFERMPEHDKALLGDFNKQLEAINSERLKARASGMWQPDSRGARDIAKDEAKLLLQRDALMKRYQGDAPAADPLSLRKPAAPAGGTKVSPMQQATNDSDRPTILAAEFKKAATAEDRAGLQREIDRLPADQRAKTKALIDGTAAPKTAAATVTKPSTAPGRMQAVAAKASADEIPSPPSETRQVGLSTKPNPDFIEWRAKYGVAYAKKQADDDAAGSLAASAAKRTYNPFAQNRVN